jgi:hypothetical protein
MHKALSSISNNASKIKFGCLANKIKVTKSNFLFGYEGSLPNRFMFKKIRKQLGTVAHICNSSYSGGRDWKVCGSRPAQAKSYMLGNKPDIVVPVVPAMGENTGRRITI